MPGSVPGTFPHESPTSGRSGTWSHFSSSPLRQGMSHARGFYVTGNSTTPVYDVRDAWRRTAAAYEAGTQWLADRAAEGWGRLPDPVRRVARAAPYVAGGAILGHAALSSLGVSVPRGAYTDPALFSAVGLATRNLGARRQADKAFDRKVNPPAPRPERTTYWKGAPAHRKPYRGRRPRLTVMPYRRSSYGRYDRRSFRRTYARRRPTMSAAALVMRSFRRRRSYTRRRYAY